MKTSKRFGQKNGKYFDKRIIAGGSAAGLVNGLLGSGGGMVAVPALENSELSPKQAHSGSVAIMLPLSALSAFMYIRGGRVAISDALPYLPAGMIGALVGGLLMNRISTRLLRKIFGAFAIWAGARMLMR